MEPSDPDSADAPPAVLSAPVVLARHRWDVAPVDGDSEAPHHTRSALLVLRPPALLFTLAVRGTRVPGEIDRSFRPE